MRCLKQDVDARDKRGHDEVGGPSPSSPGLVAAIPFLTRCVREGVDNSDKRCMTRWMDRHCLDHQNVKQP